MDPRLTLRDRLAIAGFALLLLGLLLAAAAIVACGLAFRVALTHLGGLHGRV